MDCKKDEWKGRCCCTCRWHIEDFHHCTTIDRSKFADKDCVCSLHKGWICFPLAEGRAHSGWTEHGICEMHDFMPAND
jgi:hypothetical protein